jgi:two-component system response regulator HydG
MPQPARGTRAGVSVESADDSRPSPREGASHTHSPMQRPLLAVSRAMAELLEATMRLAPLETTILVTGETGVGKERIAKLLHEGSRRREGAFVAVNCGAIPESLLESDLFGHVRGAFTGAATDRIGLFEAARGGTLFLDEVGDVSPSMQLKLLRVLQERTIRRVGETRERAIDVRIVAATHRDLAVCVANGSFRRDLFYRLQVIELRVPPLRDRPDDILPLARVLLADVAARFERAVPELSEGAADRLLRHPWPGNVRELENAMERAVALARSARIEATDLPLDAQAAQLLVPAPPVTLAAVERAHILAVLARNEGHRERTALQLGIGSATLYRKLKAYGAT